MPGPPEPANATRARIPRPYDWARGGRTGPVPTAYVPSRQWATTGGRPYGSLRVCLGGRGSVPRADTGVCVRAAHDASARCSAAGAVRRCLSFQGTCGGLVRPAHPGPSGPNPGSKTEREGQPFVRAADASPTFCGFLSCVPGVEAGRRVRPCSYSLPGDAPAAPTLLPKRSAKRYI